MEDRKAIVMSRYGENHPITGAYDKELAVTCINGTFVGKRSGDVIEYKGIPFVGEQPEGKNRFKAPVPFRADNGVYEARYYAPVPRQGEDNTEESSYYVQSEACLYLNVWKNTSDPGTKKPVMVWIHGGAFQQGGTADPLYDGLNFATANPDVVLVTITYRVGVLGFLHLSHLPDGADYPDAQNLGLLDQQMALKWIHENIDRFGGDPENITIFGESAGGASVTLLMLMPEAKRYIRHVIAQSGGPVFTANTEKAIACAKTVLELCGCSTVAELCALPSQKLVEASDQLVLQVWPERDGRVIPVEPYAAFARGEAKEISLLQGCNKDEMGYFVSGMGGPESFMDFFGTRFVESVSAMEPKDAENARAYMKQAAQEEYLQLAMIGDQTYFRIPLFRVSEDHTAGGGTVFQYFFTAESSVPYTLSGHAVEVPSVLNNMQETLFTGRPFDTAFSRTIQRMWVQFAKTGNPSLTAAESPNGKDNVWLPYTSERKDIMVLDEHNIHMSNEAELQLIDWERTYGLIKYYCI